MIDMFRRMTLPAQLLLGFVFLTLLACGGSGGSSDPEPPAEDLQRVNSSQAGSGLTNFNVLIGGTIDLVVSYDPNPGTDGILEGTPADTIVFDYDTDVFETIAPITIPTPGQAFNTTITVNVRVNAPVSMETVTTRLQANGTNLPKQENTELTINVTSADPDAVSRIVMTPENPSNTGVASGQLLIVPTPTGNQVWNSETTDVTLAPSSSQTVTAGNTGFTFDANSTGDRIGFGSFSWRRQSDNYQVYYEYLFHPDSELFFGSTSWTGTLSDGGAGTATLTLTPTRTDTAGQGGWSSNVSVPVTFTVGANPAVNWTEQLTYPFQLSSGVNEYRVSFTANGTDIDATVQVRTNGTLTATYTGTLTAN